MKFVLPVVSYDRLTELLVYLGNRAKDFKKCFDVKSKWCWMYADLMLRGAQKRKLKYAEAHHMVPYCFYKLNGETAGRNTKKLCDHNLTILTYSEHIYAHYCAVNCSKSVLENRLAIAFNRMYKVENVKGRLKIPDKEVLLANIPAVEADRIRSKIDAVRKVEKEGRTHKWEDSSKAAKDYRNANKDKIRNLMKKYREIHRDELNEKKIKWRNSNIERAVETNRMWKESHKKQVEAYNKEYRAANKDKMAKYSKKRREENREKIIAQERKYRDSHRSELCARAKKYRKEHLDECKAREKKYRDSHKEKRSAQYKAWATKNSEKVTARNRAYWEANKERRSAEAKAWREAKKAAGFRYKKDPATGKRGWIFVGTLEDSKTS